MEKIEITMQEIWQATRQSTEKQKTYTRKKKHKN
jgi:hypothetical protein